MSDLIKFKKLYLIIKFNLIPNRMLIYSSFFYQALSTRNEASIPPIFIKACSLPSLKILFYNPVIQIFRSSSIPYFKCFLCPNFDKTSNQSHPVVLKGISVPFQLDFYHSVFQIKCRLFKSA